MPPRYVVRTQAEDHRYYSVWDNKPNRVATSPEGREYFNLGFEDAVKIADALNEQDNT